MREVIYFFALLSGMCGGVYKRWAKDTNYENSLNWDVDRSPCGNDVAIIPEESPIVFIQINTSIRELVLPHEGLILLGSDMTLAFSDTRDQVTNCPGSSKNVEFSNRQAPAWMDPLNWCQTMGEHTDCQHIHLLDSQKIPGTYDDVVFPGEQSFWADLGTGTNVTVSTLNIWNKSFTSETFRDFRKTSEGLKLFPSAKNGQQRIVALQRQECTDETGCVTGNDVREIMGEICKFQKPRCRRPQCHSPVRPNGHCCNMCGAVLALKYNSGFRLKKLIDGINRNVLSQNESFSDVVFIASKLSDGETIQLVLTDDDGQRSGQAADMVEFHIKSDIDNRGIIYKVSSLDLRKSGSPRSPTTGKHRGSDSVPGGEIAGIVIGLAAVLGFVALAAILVYRRRIRGIDDFKFQIFKQFSLPRRHERSGVEAPTRRNFNMQVPENVGPSDQAFENPMFGCTTYDNGKYFELSPTENQPEKDKSGSFANPMYDMQMEESVFEDPTKLATADKMKTETTEETTDA